MSDRIANLKNLSFFNLLAELEPEKGIFAAVALAHAGLINPRGMYRDVVTSIEDFSAWKVDKIELEG